MNRLLDWRLWLAWTLAMLSTCALVALIAMVGIVRQAEHKLDGRSQQSLCIAGVQDDFDRDIADVVNGSINKDSALIAQGQTELRKVEDRFDHMARECPSP
jgi:hypothetical protein